MAPSDFSRTIERLRGRAPVNPVTPCPEFDPDALVGWERNAEPLFRWVNTAAFPKWIGMTWLWWTSRIWMGVATCLLWNHSGMEHLEALDDTPPPRGILLVGNHRSFFDMFVAITILWWHTGLVRRIYFPVLAKFFYESFAGIVVNFFFAGGSMWPPVFRDDRKAELNPVGLDQMAWVADQPGTILGMHPEGTRGKGPDEHFIQPARRGVGELIKRCHPDMIVLPFFVGGMTNDFPYEVSRNLRPSKRGDGIRYNWGEPVRAGDFDRHADGEVLADEILGHVRILRDVDRARVGLPPWSDDAD